MSLQTNKDNLESKIINLMKIIKSLLLSSILETRQTTAKVNNISKNQTNDSATDSENFNDSPEETGKNIVNLTTKFSQNMRYSHQNTFISNQPKTAKHHHCLTLNSPILLWLIPKDRETKPKKGTQK